MWRLLFDPAIYLPRDSFHYHYKYFHYIASYLRNFKEIPDWNYALGMALPPLANNHNLLNPYRVIGYLLAAFTSMDVNTAYKFSFLILGQGTFLLGLFFLIRKLLSTPMAILGILLSLLTSLSFALPHQEQVLSSMFFVPWVLFTLLKCRENPRWVVVSASLLGLSVNLHYPHLLVFYYSLLALAIGRLPKLNARLALQSLIAFLISASPLIYSYVQYHDKLSSPFREQPDSITTSSYDEYLKINKMGPSSVTPESFGLYTQWTPNAIPIVGEMDDLTFRMTLAIPIALLLTFFLNVAFKRAQLIVIIGLAMLSLGIHGPAPIMAWYALPGISLFRQWYHFIPFLNLHLLLLFLFLIHRHRAIGMVLVPLALVHGIYQTRIAYDRIIRQASIEEAAKIGIPSSERFPRRFLAEYDLLPPIAIPNDINFAKMKGDALEGFPRWQFEDGSTRKVKVGEVRMWLVGNRIQFSIDHRPEKAKGLLLLQHADGNWRGAELCENEAGLLCLSTIYSEISIHRARSLWPVLILLMWIPLIVSLIKMPPKRVTSSPSRGRLIQKPIIGAAS